MKLASIITGTQTISLISESDTHLVLSLLDTRTGEVKRLDISADMAVLPDEALIGLKVTDDRDYVNLREWWAHGDIATEAQQHVIITPETCHCNKMSDESCNVCDGGLAICAICGKAEIELDGLCLPRIVTEPAPPATWTITPDGQEIELRVREGGLF